MATRLLKRMAALGSLLAMMSWFAISGCTLSNQPDESPPGSMDERVWVQIVIYSGREDPRVLLDAVDSGVLLAEFAGLEWTPGDLPAGRLGFSGFRVSGQGEDPNGSIWVTKDRVYREVVSGDGAIAQDVALSTRNDVFTLISELILDRYQGDLEEHVVEELRNA